MACSISLERRLAGAYWRALDPYSDYKVNKCYENPL
jgi:hypothetical protein